MSGNLAGLQSEEVAAGSLPADRLLLVGLGVVALSAVVAVVVAALQGWTPTSDQAFIELRVRDIPPDPPLLGAWSRYGWVVVARCRLLDDRVEGLVAVRVSPGSAPLETDPVPVDACGR